MINNKSVVGVFSSFVGSVFLLLLLGVSKFLCDSYSDSGNLLDVSALGSPDLYLSELSVCWSFDYVSVCCVLMVSVCGFLCVSYCENYYPSYASFNYGLNLVIRVFIFFMIALVLSGSMYTTLFCWDGVSIVSFCLILFYGDAISMRGGLISIFFGRLGDVALMFLFALVEYHGCYLEGVIAGFMALVAVFTKGSFMPFCSWLLEAMNAPMPVSALVHSSTIVVCGVWLCLKYNGYMGASFSDLVEGSGYFSLFESCLVVGSLATIFGSALCGLFYKDLKKLIALSTQSSIGWCALFLGYGLPGVSVMLLLVHAVCKCVLFLSVGSVTSSWQGSYKSTNSMMGQCVWGDWKNSGYSGIVFGLTGFPCFGVFWCKGYLASYTSMFGPSYIPLFVEVLLLMTFLYGIRFAIMLVAHSNGAPLSWLRCFFFSFCYFSWSQVGLVISMFSVSDLFVFATDVASFYLFCVVVSLFVGIYYGISYVGVWYNNYWGPLSIWLSSMPLTRSVSVWSCGMNGYDYLNSKFYNVFSNCVGVFHYSVVGRWERYFSFKLLEFGERTRESCGFSWLLLNYLILSLVFMVVFYFVF